jgi:uncharacterized protein
MPEYLSPGVYMEEVDRGPKPIEGVGTAMAAFVGFTEKAELLREVDGAKQTEDLLRKPHLVTNWSQYVEAYGGFVGGAYLPHAVYGYFNNGGTRCYVVSIKRLGDVKAETKLLENGKPGTLLARARQPGNPGLLQIVIEPEKWETAEGKDSPATGAARTPRRAGQQAAPPAGPGEDAAAAGANPVAGAGDPGPVPGNGHAAPVEFKITVRRRKDETAEWSVKETLQGVRFVSGDAASGSRVQVAYKAKPSQWVDLIVPAETTAAQLAKLLSAEQTLELKVEPKDLTVEASAFLGSASDEDGQLIAVSERSGLEGLAAHDGITMVCFPDLMAAARRQPNQAKNLEMIKTVQTAMVNHCELMGDRVAILDAPPDLSPQEVLKWRMDVAGYDSSYAALYYPWIKIYDPILNQPIAIPPSGHVAGIWARSDNTRGVHKAPANEIVGGAVDLATNITKGEQDTLNPAGVNCIRSFPGMGIRVWGARTLAGSNPAWRYINVRRLFNYVEKSIELGTQWVVFEPNDPFLWARVTRDVTAFLSGVWSSGALFGATPQEAFFVKCDAELNPESSRNEGKLIIEIGMAPVKPAEFVIFRVMQWSATS